MEFDRVRARERSSSAQVAIVMFAVTIPFLLGTVGSFGLSFGVGTSCTNEWSLQGTSGLSGSPCSVVLRAVLANTLVELAVIVIALAYSGAIRIWPMPRFQARWWPVVISNPAAIAVFATAIAYAKSYPLSR